MPRGGPLRRPARPPVVRRGRRIGEARESRLDEREAERAEALAQARVEPGAVGARRREAVGGGARGRPAAQAEEEASDASVVVRPELAKEEDGRGAELDEQQRRDDGPRRGAGPPQEADLARGTGDSFFSTLEAPPSVASRARSGSSLDE